MKQKEYCNASVKKISKLSIRVHHYAAEHLGEYLKYLKENLPQDEVFSLHGFCQELFIHWARCAIVCVVSNCLNHPTLTVYAHTYVLFQTLKF